MRQHSLGGRLTRVQKDLKQQTHNLAIGVRVPASQPFIPSSHLTDYYYYYYSSPATSLPREAICQDLR